MSLFDKIFRPQKVEAEHFLKTLTAYEPRFRSWRGCIYESEVVRSAIDARARYFSKLTVKIDGAAQPKLQTILKKRPNPYQTWPQFMYRLSTILDIQNTVFIVPMLNRDNDVYGLWLAIPSECSVMEDKRGNEYLKYKFRTGGDAVVELDRCGILTKYQYLSDFFGESNKALDETIDLISLERQGIKEAIKSAATFRFIARGTNWKKPEDLAQEQKNFNVRHLSIDKSGLLLFPNTMDGIMQVKSDPFSIPATEVNLIRDNVYNYFGVNEKILQNKATAEDRDGFFDGAIEPNALQLAEALTFMLFTDAEISYGAHVRVTADRLAAMSISEKINLITALSDRGFITINEGRELLNYQALPAETGDKLPIRGEYSFVGEQEKENTDDQE